MSTGCDNYLEVYRQFLQSIVDKNPIKDIEFIRIGFASLLNTEVIGSLTQWSATYLIDNNCPADLIGPLVNIIVERCRTACKKNPTFGGYNYNEESYETFRLLQLMFKTINDVCVDYLDNRYLDTLPVPIKGEFKPVSRCSIKNFRRTLEDKLTIVHDLNSMFNRDDNDIISYYAVFDGHVTHHAATYCSEHLHQHIVESKYYPHKLEEAMYYALQKTDKMFAEKCLKQNIHGGTTAICAIHQKRLRKLIIAWVGDSQAILSRNSNCIQLVTPHKPNQKSEELRIKQAGGSVLSLNGVSRVYGSLSVSRAIGDFEFRPAIIAEPEILTIRLNDQDDFFVLACDGLWEHVTEDEVSDFIYDYVQNNYNLVNDVSLSLSKLAKQKGSVDNITIIVVFLKDVAKINRKMETSLENNTLDSFLVDIKPFSTTTTSDTDNGDDDTVDFFCDKSPHPDPLIEQKNSKNEKNFEQIDESNQMKSLSQFLDTNSNQLKDNGEGQGDNEDDDDDDEDQIIDFLAENSSKNSHYTEVSENAVNADSEESEDEWNYYRMENKCETSNSTNLITKEVSDISDNESKSDRNSSDMNSNESIESQLNPNAAEFVPHSPIRNQLNTIFDDQIISQSPKRPLPVLDILDVEGTDFSNEIKQRPSDANVVLKTVHDFTDDVIMNQSGFHEESAVNEVVVDLNATHDLSASDIDENLILDHSDSEKENHIAKNSFTQDVPEIADHPVSKDSEICRNLKFDLNKSEVSEDATDNVNPITDVADQLVDNHVDESLVSKDAQEPLILQDVEESVIANEVDKLLVTKENHDDLVKEEVNDVRGITEMAVEIGDKTDLVNESSTPKEMLTNCHEVSGIYPIAEKFRNGQNDEIRENLVVEIAKEFQIVNNESSIDLHENQQPAEEEELVVKDTEVLIGSPKSDFDCNPEIEAAHCLINLKSEAAICSVTQSHGDDGKKEPEELVNVAENIEYSEKTDQLKNMTLPPTLVNANVVGEESEAKVEKEVIVPVENQEKKVVAEQVAEVKKCVAKSPLLPRSKLGVVTKASAPSAKLTAAKSNSGGGLGADRKVPLSTTATGVKKTTSATTSTTGARKPAVATSSTTKKTITARPISVSVSVSATTKPMGNTVGPRVATKVVTQTAKPASGLFKRKPTVTVTATVSTTNSSGTPLTNGSKTTVPPTSATSKVKPAAGTLRGTSTFSATTSARSTATIKLPASRLGTTGATSAKRTEVKKMATSNSKVAPKTVSSSTVTTTSVKRPISNKLAAAPKTPEADKLVQNGEPKVVTSTNQVSK